MNTEEMYDENWQSFAKDTMDILTADLEYSRQLKNDAKSASIDEDKKYFLCVLKENTSLVLMQTKHLLDYRTKNEIFLMSRNDAQNLIETWNRKNSNIELKYIHFSHFASEKFEECRENFEAFSRIFKRALAA